MPNPHSLSLLQQQQPHWRGQISGVQILSSSGGDFPPVTTSAYCRLRRSVSDGNRGNYVTGSRSNSISSSFVTPLSLSDERWWTHNGCCNPLATLLFLAGSVVTEKTGNLMLPKFQNQEGPQANADMASITPIQGSDVEDWANFRDDDIMQQQSAIQAVEAEKIPLVEHFGARLFGLWNPHKDLFKFADLRKRWRISRQVFPLTPAEQHAVRGVRRKIDDESSASDSCAFKRRRDAQFHPSPFERSFSAVSPICSQIGDGDGNYAFCLLWGTVAH
ncbi:unnamed protein product [Camellia sinensis]